MQLSAEVSTRLAMAAILARERAYAPYSHFLVGAAILTDSGDIILGCNVENASYGLTICAERGAVASAVATGQRNWKAIAVATIGAVTPCGACRQVLAEFGENLEVILVDADSRAIKSRCTTGSLLPGAFTLKTHP